MSSEILSALWQSAAQQQFPTHALYLVATPIGNQADISIRALAVLSKVDAIACEDTRHSKTLLNQYGIQKPLIAAHEHNENAAAQQIIERLQRGERIALITDAGTPAISDPGARVVAHARAAGLRVVPIPGASAVVTALSATGVEHGFSFVGFLPAKSAARAHTLDQWQQRQKGGTVVGSLIMGMIAALIVGPCMSAPLAGALLFVSQLPDAWMGASYLFVLGLGIGLPLFIACVFGAQYLPKPGIWMDRLKFTFGFVMLLLAVYFLRPLLPSVLYLSMMGLFFVGMAIYILWKIRPNVTQTLTQLLLILLSLGTVVLGGWHFKQAWSQINTAQAETRLVWKKVRTQDEFTAALAAVKGQPVLIDVYADWCVACQPIKKDVLPRTDVQAALQHAALVKLDLTEYDPSQDILLKEWQILGPPTMIFLDASHQEKREIRLTGTFSAEQLISRAAQQGTAP